MDEKNERRGAATSQIEGVLRKSVYWFVDRIEDGTILGWLA
jgi:hypothetical protein